jgi:hypothetical protein
VRSPIESLIDRTVSCVDCGAGLGHCSCHDTKEEPPTVDALLEVAEAAVEWRKQPTPKAIKRLRAAADELARLGWR